MYSSAISGPLTPSQSNGYLRVNLFENCHYKTYFVHRLVARAFIPNPHDLPCVNHKDGNRANNHVSNLEWCTYAENNKHARQMTAKKETENKARDLFEKGESITQVITALNLSVKDALAIKHNL